MNFFTYNDYKDYEKNARIKKDMERAKKNIEYISKMDRQVFLKEESNNEIDKLIDIQIQELLKDKEEAKIFIKEFLKTDIQELKEVNFLSLKNQLYQLDNREIYFLIKYQTKINIHISYKILLDSNHFMQEWEDKKSRERTNFPILVPIVLYPGIEPWTQYESEKKTGLKYIKYERNGMYLKYNLIDTNQYPSLKLMRMKSSVANLLVLKRYKNNEDRKDIVNILLDECDSMEKLLKLNKIKRMLI